MRAVLPAASRTKLAKLLAQLGADEAEKRGAAALAAHRLIQSRGLSWSVVLNPKPLEHSIPERGIWRQTVRDCLAKPEGLKPWEASFLRDLPNFRRLSTKQRYCLKEIADRLLARRTS